MYIIESINKNVLGCLSTFDVSLENQVFKTKLLMTLIDYYNTKDINLENIKVCSTENNKFLLEEVRVDKKSYDFLIRKIKTQEI